MNIYVRNKVLKIILNFENTLIKQVIGIYNFVKIYFNLYII